MQIVEVKNNLVKVNYNAAYESPVLSGFVVVKDAAQSFIAQVVYLEANSKGNFAIVKLLFNFDANGVITSYNGSVPNIEAQLELIPSQELLDLLPVQTPLVMGELSQQKTLLTVDFKLLEEKLLVACEKSDDKEVLIKNFAKQLAYKGKKLLVIDLEGNLKFSRNRVIAGDNFKLPLNYETINFIYEKGLEDAKAETKALIQEVLLDVQEYVKSLPQKFISFGIFKNVVDSQYTEMKQIELVLLKNKLLRYEVNGVFAQGKDDFKSLELSLKHDLPTIFDVSKVDAQVQREMISYVYSLIKDLNKETYVIFNVNDANSDKKLLKQAFTTPKAYSTMVCSYSYKYLKELKQLCRNMIMFAPIQQQDDFASYNMFLSKLNAHEFIVYGQATHHLPLIVTLSDIPDAVYENISIGAPKPFHQPSEEEIRDEQIKKEVDRIYTAPKNEESIQQQIMPEHDELTEEDLDFIDDLNIADAVMEENVIEENPSEPEIREQIIDDLYERPLEEFPSEEFSEPAAYQEPQIEITETIQPEIQEPVYEQVPQQPKKIEIRQAPEYIQEEPQEEFIPEPPEVDLPPRQSVPIVPVYSAEIEPQINSDDIGQGDMVTHPKYGRGTVEKLISYGSKTLCSINFDNVGRRLLDPSLAEIKKI